jgi:multicomponent Na+:H+ antiporter subunit F
MSVLAATLDGPLAWGAAIAGLLVIVGALLATYRLLVGPTLADRVVALDLLTMLLAALLVLLAIALEVPAYLDAALALSLVSFLSTVAFARYVERRDPEPAPKDDEHGP